MKRCEQCGRWFKTIQGLVSHRLVHIRLTRDDAETIRGEQQLKDKRITELEASLATKSERVTVLEERIKASECPKCGRWGWDDLPIEERPKKSFDKGKLEKPLWKSRNEPMVNYRICPWCDYYEEVENIPATLSSIMQGGGHDYL